MKLKVANFKLSAHKCADTGLYTKDNVRIFRSEMTHALIRNTGDIRHLLNTRKTVNALNTTVVSEESLLGAIAKLRKVTTGFVMSVCPSVRPSVYMEQLG